MSYLDTVRSFADVKITEKGIDTVEFLEASDGLAGMFDLFGSSAFSVVQADIRGNIKKVRDRYNAKPEESATLEELILNEKGEKKRTATEGLLWLLRGLSFTRIGFQHSYDDDKEEMAAAFTKSYESTLKKFHNFIVKGVFSVAMKACPYRKDFYTKLQGTATEADTKEKFGKWLAALKNITEKMDAFYEAGSHAKGF